MENLCLFLLLLIVWIVYGWAKVVNSYNGRTFREKLHNWYEDGMNDF